MTTGWTEDIDALFSLPLADFTAARNALAARIKREGRGAEAERVKSLSKPSVSAWAVNQLYWRHRKEFDRLMDAGREFRNAQTAQISGESADARQASKTRHEAISELLRLGAALLREGDHNPSPETVRRIGATLEAMSAYESLPDTVLPGRLTEDLEAPGFDALTALFSGGIPTKKPAKPADRREKQRADQTAEAALREARQALTKAEAKARVSQTALEKASVILEEADRRKREAEERLSETKVAAEQAARNVIDARREVERLVRGVGH